nr:efflux RND transporter periplasmic adaptor subunit [Altericroceibacterium xinjiangense]
MQAEADDRQSRKRTILITVAIGIVLLLVAVWLLTRGGEEAAFAPADAQVPTVSVVAPGNTTVQGTINATGTIAARREMPVGVVGEGGRIVSVPVEAGQWVRAGQVLAVIDQSVQAQQAASAAAQVDVAQADADLAQANLDRALQLVDRGFISRADVDRLTATRDAAVARVAVARAQYRELLARNERLSIVAPAAGLLLQRNVEPGQVVGAGSEALFTIARGGQMELLAALSEDDLAAISVGAPATVTPVGAGESFAGQVWQISPVIDPQNRQGTARIALGYEPELRPGGFASAEIGRGAIVAPRLPESAILSDEQGSYVYIVDANNKVVRRPVTTGLVTDQGIAIASGLTGRELVILRAGGFLNPGDTVRTARVSADGQAGPGA